MPCKNLTLSTYSLGSSQAGSKEGKIDQIEFDLSSVETAGEAAALSCCLDMAALHAHCHLLAVKRWHYKSCVFPATQIKCKREN